MRDSFLIFGRPMIGEEEIAEVVDSLRSGWVGTGPKVHRFETLLSDYLGVEHCRCVSSCTAALILSLQVLGCGAWRRGARAGDDVRGIRQRGRARGRQAGARRLGAGHRPHRPRAGGGGDHPTHAGDHARSPGGPACRHGPARRAREGARPSGRRGRRARDRRGVARTQDRRIRQLDRVLVLRDQEHLDDRRRRAGHRRSGRGCRGRAARASRSQPRRLATLLRRRLSPL